MPTAENAKLQYESGQDLTAFTALTDAGDQQEYRSAANLWSNRSGYAPDIKPNGSPPGLWCRWQRPGLMTWLISQPALFTWPGC